MPLPVPEPEPPEIGGWGCGNRSNFKSLVDDDPEECRGTRLVPVRDHPPDPGSPDRQGGIALGGGGIGRVGPLTGGARYTGGGE